MFSACRLANKKSPEYSLISNIWTTQSELLALHSWYIAVTIPTYHPYWQLFNHTLASDSIFSKSYIFWLAYWPYFVEYIAITFLSKCLKRCCSSTFSRKLIVWLGIEFLVENHFPSEFWKHCFFSITWCCYGEKTKLKSNSCSFLLTCWYHCYHCSFLSESLWYLTYVLFTLLNFQNDLSWYGTIFINNFGLTVCQSINSHTSVLWNH